MKKLAIILLVSWSAISCFKKEVDTVATPNTDSTTAAQTALEIATEVPDSATSVIDSTAAQPATTKMDYSTAKSLNTPLAWRTFLKDNPDFADRDEIEKNIIRAEVSEISNAKDTGEMPQAEKLNGGNQARSSIMVENDTACDLVLRYSGTDALRVTIPPNSTQKVTMQSGTYQVAATACGYNYAGSESLAGDYEVVYYIKTGRF